MTQAVTEQKRFLNLGSGYDIRPAAEGWVNMDGFYAPAGVIKHDFVRTPWPFPDGHFDLVYCSHVLEHIPTIFRERDGVMRDVFFDVMEEIHRVLKPGGVLHLKVPWGGSDTGYANPQHYRQWHDNWFNYFSPDYQENYYSTARFRVLESKRNPHGYKGQRYLKFGRGKEKWGLTVHLAKRIPFLRPLLVSREELEAKLVALK